MDLLSPVMTAFLTAALNALGDFFLKQQQADTSHTDAVNTGTLSNVTAVQQETINAQQRANQAALIVPDVDGMLTALLNGQSI